MRDDRNRLPWLLSTLLGLTLACAPSSDATLRALPPPEGWQSELAARRAARDRQFQSGTDSPLLPTDLASFAGLDYFPPTPGYYFVGHITAYPDPERFEIPTTAGKTRPCAKVGWLSFELGGARRTLQVYQLLDRAGSAAPGDLFVPFLDATAGRETYPAGRYIDLVGRPEGPVVLDFNGAYNPSCAYGDASRFACPVTPAANRLEIPISAGERGWRQEHGS